MTKTKSNKKKSSKSSLEKDREALVDDLQQLVDDIRQLSEDVKDTSADYIDEKVASARKQIDRKKAELQEHSIRAKNQALEYGDSVTSFIQEKPWTAVCIALGAGIILDRLLSDE